MCLLGLGIRMELRKLALAASAAWLTGAFAASAQDTHSDDKRKSVRITIDGQVSNDEFQERLSARIVAAFADLPIAFGATAEKGNGLERLMLGSAANLSEALDFSITGQFVREDADKVFGLATDQNVDTWSIASSLDLRLNGSSKISLGVDGWNSPSVLLADTPIFQTRFDGASGTRISAGLETYLDPTLRVDAKLGYELAVENGDDGIFAKIDFSKAFGKLSVEGSAWTSPNFGDGGQIGLGYRFDSDLIASVYAGYRDGATEGAYAGARLSIEFGPSTSEANGALADRLDRQMQHAQLTMPGVPKTARTSTVTKVTFPFVTAYGDVCQTVEATPGCTFFGADGTRITVAEDPDYNKFGNGADDLWYVRFDISGRGAIYNQLGQFQRYEDVSAFSGYMGGTTIGVGNTGFYWENVVNGTYWLGKNSVLYSANMSGSNFGQAIN